MLRALRPVAIAVAVALALALPATAHANGDPASDVLLTDTVFLGYDAPSREQVDKLRGVIQRSRDAGQPVRVAIIHSPSDLGTVAKLFGHPREYAELLRGELINPVEPGARGNREALLVVMPAGYGTGNVPPQVDRKLRGIEVPADATPDELAAAAGYGVQELAKASGKSIPATFPKPDAGGGGGALTAVLIVVALAGVLAGLIIVRVRGVRGQAETHS